MITALLVLGGLLVASAFFSGTEVAMFSLRRVDRERMRRSTHKSDALVMRMLAQPRRLIATVLIGNEAVNVSVAALVASMATLLVPDGSEFEQVLFSSAVALPLLLLVGEISPKTVAMKTAVSWSRAVSRPLWLFDKLVYPIRVVVTAIAYQTARRFSRSSMTAAARGLSEDEFRTLMEAGREEGEVDAREFQLIDRVFRFDNTTVVQAMVTRARIFALPAGFPCSHLAEKIAAQGYSRVPIYEGTLDNIVGVLHARDLLPVLADRAGPVALQEILHEPLFVCDTISVAELFEMFRQGKTHMALVRDAHGELLGLVTMADVLGELFGRDSSRPQTQDARQTNLATDGNADET